MTHNQLPNWYFNALCHHGIIGQKWGVRRTKEQFAKSGPILKMNLQFFAKHAGSRKTVRLSKREYAHVMSELMTRITKEQKKQKVIHKAIGDYTYTFENFFNDTYRVIGKKRIPDTLTGLKARINDGK